MKRQTPVTTRVLHIVPGLGPGGMELGMAKVISGLNGNGMRPVRSRANSTGYFRLRATLQAASFFGSGAWG